MSSKYWIVCIVLFIVILFLAFKSYDALTHPAEIIPDKGAAKKPEARAEIAPSMGFVTRPGSAVSHNLIAEKNIFSPERKDFQATGPGSASNAVTRPQVILYGVTIAGNYQSASLVNPGRPLKKGERDLMTLKLGERIGEYKLTKVLSDRITLEAQGDSFEVLLYDTKVPKRREGGSPGAPSPAFTPTAAPRPLVRTEATKETRGSVQEKTSAPQAPMPMTPALDPSQVPSSAPTPAQSPGPTAPTPIAPQFTPTFPALPPGMGQPVPVPPEMGHPIPITTPTPTQPPSPGGR